MFLRCSRRVLLSGVVLTIIALSACATESGSGVSEQAVAATPMSASGGVPAAAGAPATAVMPGGATARATGTHAAKGSRAAASSSASRASTAVARPAAGAPAAAISGATVYGFSAPELMLNQSTQGAELQAMKAMGVNSVRLEANWYGMQPNGPSDNDWASLDQLIASVQAAGLTADLVIDGTPPWAAVSGAQGDDFAQPASPAQF